MASRSKYRLGIDVGGTFTDLVLAGEDGSIFTKKVPTTPDDYGRGIVGGVRRMLDEQQLQPGDIATIVHATTVATNAILEGKGARTALVTTKGFRDVLEMRRLRIPEMYVLNYQRPTPLVPRNLRFEVDERMKADGSVLEPLSEASLAKVADMIEAAGVEAVAICLLHSYVNRAHEARVLEFLRERLPESVFITASADLLPEIREYERTSTTVINAYLGPVLRRYFDSLVQNFTATGVRAPILVMKSDGGVMSIAQAATRPAYIVESGPSAGVIGAADVASRNDLPALITLDMGGTTAKASLVEAGQVAKSADYEVGAGINLSGRLIMGGGHALKLPVIDISEIGAGGGSIVGIDRAGTLTVGPHSAGAVPGPVAYGLGGTDPTLTDSMIVLGYINPTQLVGGDLTLDAQKAADALREKVADPLDRSITDTAYGVVQVAAATMVRAVKAVSTYRGRDPRDFTLFAFGGNGPVLATEIATLLEMQRVIVPTHPGVFSACGLLRSPIEHEVMRSFVRPLTEVPAAELESLLRQFSDDLLGFMEQEGCDRSAVVLAQFADLRYLGQAHELTVPLRLEPDGRWDFAATCEAFHAEHHRTYGRRSDANPIQCVNIRVRGTVPPSSQPIATTAARFVPAADANRRVYFGPRFGHLSTPVVSRRALADAPRPGPMILEEYDTTCIIPPNWTASADASGNVLLNCLDTSS